MKKFHFSLRPVGIVRAHQELRAREALAASINAYAESAELLMTARRRVGELAEAMATGRRGRLRAADEAAFNRAYCRECAAELEAQKRFIAARGAMEKSREAYMEANQRLKVVERLEQRARAVHRLDALRAEQAEIDEIAGRRGVRRALSA
jgi:flagellar FliJ protein